MNIGAKNAKGEWFIFIHADTRLEKKWFTKISSFLNENESNIYFFKFKVNNKKIIYRFLEILVNLRSNFLKTPYGDQGLIISREAYYKNNGYKNIPLMEDLEFIKRLNNKNFKILNFPIYISSRKWENNNVFFQSLKNWQLRRRWLKGDSINLYITITIILINLRTKMYI